MTSPPYKYGQLLRTLSDAYRRLFEEITAGFTGDAPRALTVEEQEASREAAYRRRLARERRIGLHYVQRYADDVRDELGLP